MKTAYVRGHAKERKTFALVTERGVCVEVYPGQEVVVDFDPELTFDCVDDVVQGRRLRETRGEGL